MYRAIAVLGIVVGLGLISGAAPGPKQPSSIVQKLHQRVNFDGIDNPRADLNDALEKLSKLYDVSLEINDALSEWMDSWKSAGQRLPNRRRSRR